MVSLNLLWKKRRVIKDSEILGVFSPAPTNWAVQAYRVDWTGLNELGLLETDEYRTDMVYDGLSRPISVELPGDLDSERKLVVPTYNRSGAMESISLDGDVYVSRIAYNAKGQRVLMAYGNGIMTRYAYDPDNFGLLRQRSEKFINPSGFPLTYEAQSGSVRQDCEYTFDLAGNIVNMTDDSPSAGVGGTGSLSRDFTYDASRTHRRPWMTASTCRMVRMRTRGGTHAPTPTTNWGIPVLRGVEGCLK